MANVYLLQLLEIHSEYQYFGLHQWLSCKESTCNAGDADASLGRHPREGHSNPLQDSCLKNLHGQRRLAVYSPWGCKELDVTEVTEKKH